LRSLILVLFLTFIFLPSLKAQEKERQEISGMFTTRYMQTANEGDLQDFSIVASWAKINVTQRFTDWLSVKSGVVGLLNYGTNSIERRDLATGFGPIYEGNIWNQRLMEGSIATSLPELHLDFEFGNHLFQIGRFLQNTPAINAEPWPLPNALEGVWYKYQQDSGIKFQLGLIDRIAPRFGENFFDIGASIGTGGVGLGIDGLPSQYRNNVSANYMTMLNLAVPIKKDMVLEFWNYQVEEVSNTFLVESKFTLNSDKDLKLALMFIRQDRLGNGGNDDSSLRYFTDSESNAFGFSLAKSVQKNVFSLNFTRIGDQGRLLLPRDWGVEPLYTFQRRHRVEGMRDLTAVMLKWQTNIQKEGHDFKVFSSIANTWARSPTHPEDNKYQLPSNINWDVSVTFTPKKKLNGLSAELFMAYRFLSDKDSDLPIYTINRANFFHSDLIVSYVF
jgi:hypothetical protein